MSQPKLLQLNVTANWGSTGKIAEGIGQAAMKRGWKSTIAFGRHSTPSKSQIIKVGSMRDVYLHYARHRLLDDEGLGSASPTRTLVDNIRALNPDIIHLHNIHDHWLNYPLLFEYLRSVETPVVWTFHDCWAFTGHCPHFEQAGCMKWKSECGECTLRNRFSLDRSRRNFNLKRDLIGGLGKRLTVVGASQWVSDYAAESFLRDCNITTIHNGVDLSVFTPGGEKERMVLGVSNVWPAYKGLGDFVELRKILPDEVKIHLVGLTEDQIKSLPQGISGQGRTAGVEELVSLYRKASVFVNPTHNDTFPTVNLEALACGTPVVTYRTGGSPEAVDALTGLVVAKGDVKGLNEAIHTVLEAPERFASAACRLRAEKEFDRTRQFDKYIDLYESLLPTSIVNNKKIHDNHVIIQG